MAKTTSASEMKLRISAVVLISTLAMASRCAETGLFGCPDSIKIAKYLRNVQQNTWKTISAERLTSIWTNRFDELVCESKMGCRMLVSKDRVIAGHCECCEAFVFDVEQKTDGSRSEHLVNVIIHFSAHEKEKILDAGRTFAEAAGLPRTEAAKIRTDSAQRYEWKDANDQVQQSYILELRFTHQKRNWELYLSLGAETL